MNLQPTLIVGLGELLWDLLPDGKKMGGAPANFAYHASQLGYEAWAISAVGADALGDELLARLDDVGLNHHIPRLAHPTGTVQVELDNGIPRYEICEDVAWDYIAWDAQLAEMAPRTRCAVFGSLAQRGACSRATIRQYLSLMPSEGSLKIFDINLRQNYYSQDIIEESLKLCNVLKINDDEILVLQEMHSLQGQSMLESCHHYLQAYDLSYLILTCGKRGSYIISKGAADEPSFVPTPDSPVADTVGAGDSFTASLASALLSGRMSVMEAHQFATDVATFVCSEHGAMPLLPEEFKRQLVS